MGQSSSSQQLQNSKDYSYESQVNSQAEQVDQQKMESEVNQDESTNLNEIPFQLQQLKQQEQVNQQNECEVLNKTDQVNSQQFLKQEKIQQQVEDEQIEQYFEKHIKQPQNEIIQLSPEEVEHLWLSKIFKIDTNNQVINEKIVDFIPKNISFCLQQIIDELCYQFLTCTLFNESEKFEYLIELLINITDVQIKEQFITVIDGNIEKIKYYEILNYLQGQLITCILYPEGLEWEKFDEDLNRFDDRRNQRANIFYNRIFSSKQLSYCQGVVINLLEYLNSKVSADDVQKFLDLMFKRELDLCANWSLDSSDQILQTLKLLLLIADYSNIMEFILLNSWAFGKFKLIQYGKQFQNYSIIGKILSGSCFYTDSQMFINIFTGDCCSMTSQRDIVYHKILLKFLNLIKRKLSRLNKKIASLLKIVTDLLSQINSNQQLQSYRQDYNYFKYDFKNIMKLINLFMLFLDNYEQ